MDERIEQIVATNAQVGAKYDDACKEYFKHKAAIAPILKYSVPELAGMTNEQIIECIDEVSIATPVSDVGAELINENTELSSVLEKTIRYDIHFRMKNPDLSTEDAMAYLFIDFEVQNSYRPKNPKYHIEKRMIYYLCREISAQLSILTEKSNYDDIQKAYSIWVCNEDVPVKLQNTMSRYRMIKEDVIGETDDDDKELYDLTEGIIIRRGKNASNDDIFKYLESVFKSNLEGIRKYVDMDKNPEVEEEVVRMSGMGQTIYDNALLKGEKQGEIKGEKKGENRLAKLMSYLFSQGKIKEAELAATNETARKEMYKKYNIID